MARHFLRRDGKGTLLLIHLREGLGKGGKQVVDRLQAWSSRQAVPYRLTLAGALPFREAAIRVAYQDAWRLTGLLALILTGLIAFAFRSLPAALLAVLVAVVHGPAALGVAALVGLKVSHFGLITLPMILIVGLLDNIHLLYALGRTNPASPEGAFPPAVREIITPCFWTTITTAAGFLCFLVSSLPQIRVFGIVAALGTGIAFFSSILLLPRLLIHVRPATRRTFFSFSRRYHLPGPKLLLGSILVLIAVAPGLVRLRIEPDFPALLRETHPLTRQMTEIEKNWGGLTTLSYLITPRPGVRLTDPETAGRLRDFVGLLSRRALVTDVVSPLEGLMAVDAGFRRRFGRHPMPDEWETIARQLAAHPGGTGPFGSLLEAEAFRVIVRLKMMEPARFPALVKDLEGFRKNLSDLFEVQIAGWPLLYKDLERRYLGELWQGFALATVVIAVLLLIAFRSLGWWLLALPSNLLPLIVVGGVLGYLGPGFGTGLVMVPELALGLIVDDTCHFVLAVQRTYRAKGVMADAIREALATSGPPILIASAVLWVGFATLLFSSFRANQLLGGVMAAIIPLALFAEFVCLPTLLETVSRTGLLKWKQPPSP